MNTQAPWHRLPTEMKIAITDLLDVDDAKTFSRHEQGSVHTLCSDYVQGEL
jgi:hypothetical protein